MKKVGKLIRSAVVGIGATLVDLATLALLVEVVGVRPEIANVPALVLGLAAQFLGNKFFAFRDKSTEHVKQGAAFALVETGALLLNALIFHLLVTRTSLPYPLARVAGQSLVYFGFSYPLWGRIFT
jgi:putative flippase GtrA